MIKSILLLVFLPLGLLAQLVPSGVFIGTLGEVNNVNGCNGASGAGLDFSGTVDSVWVGNASYAGLLYGTITVKIPPGANNTCTFWVQTATLSSNSFPGGSGSSITSFFGTPPSGNAGVTTTQLCTISGATQKECAYSVSISVAAPWTMRGFASESGTGTVIQMGGGTFVGYWNGPQNFGSATSGSTGDTLPFCGGNIFRDANDGTQSCPTIRAYWQTQAPISAIGGVFGISTAVGAGKTLSISIGTSGIPSSTQNAVDATQTTTSTGATITGTSQLMASWAPVIFNPPIPAGSWVQLSITGTGFTPGVGLFTGTVLGLDVTYADGNYITFVTQGSAGQNSTHNFAASQWGNSDGNVPLAGEQQLNISPPDAELVACGGGITFDSAVTASGSWGLGVTVSNTSPDGTHGCTDQSYTDTGALCTISGSNKGCQFSLTPLSVPKSSCIALKGSVVSGSPSAAVGNNFNWGLTCRVKQPAGISGGIGTN